MKTFREYLLNEQLDTVKTPSVEEIAAKHKLSVEEIKKQVEIGSKIEKEHTKDEDTAEQIARDHLNEKPDYYKKLKAFVESVKEPTGDLKDACWKGYTAVGMKMKNGRKVPNCVPVKEGECSCGCGCGEKETNEATYQGREVPLNKPMKGDVKKSKVYVKDPQTGNVKKVNFGDKNLSIKKNQPARKRSYCARSSGQGNLTKKTSANYWSRRAWEC